MAKAVKQAYEYRFYPSPEQAVQLLRTFGCVRDVRNRALEVRTAAWQQRRERISYARSSALLTEVKVARVHARIADRRRDFLHKLTTRLVRENQAAVIEDLNVRNMTRNHHLARHQKREHVKPTRVPNNGSVIVTVTLNAALNVSYEAAGVTWDGVNPVSAPRHQAGGRGVMVARVLHTFGHDVVAVGLAGGATGEMIRADLATSGIPAEFTWTSTESRRILQLADTATGRTAVFREAGPYITTEELGRFAADYRRLMRDATAAVLCGSLPSGLPPEIYGTLATYASDAGVPVVVDAGGRELQYAVARGPALAVPDPVPDPDALIAAGAGAVVLPSGGEVLAVTSEGRWRAWLSPAVGAPATEAPAAQPAARGALVAGLVPGVLLGWSWPDRLRNAMALSASAARTAMAGRTTSAPGTTPEGTGGTTPEGTRETPAGAGMAGGMPAGPAASSTAAQPAPVDLAVYEQLLGQVRVENC